MTQSDHHYALRNGVSSNSMTTISNNGLKDQVDNFRRTNAFTPGDAGSFSIPLVRGQVELPGKYDPAPYLDKLEIKSPKRVAVMFAGSGGLCVEAINRGATNVWAVEPRNNYVKALTVISDMVSQVKGYGFSTAVNLNEFADFAGTFDTVIWSEGLEQLKNPVVTLEGSWKLVAPGGKLFMEVVHGEQGIPTGSINRWTPKEAVFAELLKTLVGDASVRIVNGRLQRRLIYEVTKAPAPVVVVEQPAPLPILPTLEGSEHAQIVPLTPPAVTAEADVGTFVDALVAADVMQSVSEGTTKEEDGEATDPTDQTPKPKKQNMKKKRR